MYDLVQDLNQRLKIKSKNSISLIHQPKRTQKLTKTTDKVAVPHWASSITFKALFMTRYIYPDVRRVNASIVLLPEG